MKITAAIRPLALIAAFTAAAAFAQQPSYQVEDARFGDGPITVEQRRAPLDARIQAEVMSRLRAMDNIEGLIGVETHDAQVRLTGKVTTAAQAMRAGREVRNVSGVRGVENEVRSRVGAAS
jgi:osmotically-inducible protein OsmY